MSLHERLSQAKGVATKAPEKSRRHILNEINRKIHNLLIEELGPRLYNETISRDEVKREVKSKLTALVAGEDTPLSDSEKTGLIDEISDDVLGYGPLERFLADEEVTEVMINDFQTW